MRSIFLIALCSLISHGVFCQVFRLSESEIRFFSEAVIENIEAVNTGASGLWNLESGELVLAIPIRGFTFEKSLMQEHFNEKYMESDKYPRAVFRGNLTAREGQNLTAKGKLTIHGIEKDYTIKGNITKKGGSYKLEAIFHVKLEDHSIEIPTLLWQNIAEVIEVRSILTFSPR